MGDPTPTDTNQGGNNPSSGGGGGGSSGGGPSGIDLGDILSGLGSDSGSSSSSGSSSGGSSSGGGSAAAAPVDPNISQGQRDYYDIWGTLAPFGYIEGLVKSGMNHFEIVEHELSKPRAQTTVFYRDKFAYYAAAAARLFGRR
jgi:hypothetical protein